MENVRNYLLLFADLVGSTEVAVEASPSLFSSLYIASYHWAASKAFKFVKEKGAYPSVEFNSSIESLRVSGDEVLSFTPLPESPDDQEDLIASAVAFSYVTKLFWLIGPYNLQRVLSKQFPRDVAVGIHLGPAVKVPCICQEDQIASLHINIAKRMETI